MELIFNYSETELPMDIYKEFENSFSQDKQILRVINCPAGLCHKTFYDRSKLECF
jgi:hypothetical protein